MATVNDLFNQAAKIATIGAMTGAQNQASQAAAQQTAAPATTTTATPSYGGYSGGSSSSGPTDEQRKAAANQLALAKYNAQTTKNQLSQLNANYDLADQQNRALADVQRTQNNRSTEADRFQAQRNLRNATVGLLGSMGPAMAGSTTENLMTMLRDRQDLENIDYWKALQEAQDSVENSYDESVSSNNLARNEAAIQAEYALRGIEADTAAQLNNIHPDLFVEPGTGDANFEGTGVYDANKTAVNQARLAGYLMPDASREAARKVGTTYKATGGGYFDKLLNGMNGGR